MLIVALNIVFFPLISVLLLRAVGFIDSLFLRTQKDRIIPYIASGIFFFWAYTVFKQQAAVSIVINQLYTWDFPGILRRLDSKYLFQNKHACHRNGGRGWSFFDDSAI